MRKLSVLILLGLSVLASVAFHPDSGPWRTMEERCNDHFQAFLAHAARRPLDPRIRIIGIDDDTLAELGKPQLYWPQDLAELCQGLLDHGCSAVGLDVSFAVATAKLSPAQTEPILAALLPLLQVVTTSRRVVILDLPATASSPAKPAMRPEENLAQAATEQANLAAGIAVPDRDGVFRSVLATYGKDALPGFSLRLASLLTDQAVTERDDQVYLGAELVPTRKFGTERTLRLSFTDDRMPLLSAATLLRSLRAGKPLPDLKGTVCLVAPQAASFQDFVPSPLDVSTEKLASGGTLGGELHAQAIDNLLSGRFLVAYPLSTSIVLSCLASLLFFGLGEKARLRNSLLLGLGIQAGYLAVAVLLLERNQTWVPYLPIVTASFLGFCDGYLWRYIEVERDRRRIRGFFSRMVSPQVVDKVLSDPAAQQLGGTHRRVTVLYSDINHFTPMCERHTPAEVIVMLNAYFEEMVRIIFEHEGMLKQFVGDEIMVIYGAPADQSDHAARAVRTALAMQERLLELQAASGGADGFFDIKFGIHTGDVVVGHVGSAEHMEYAAVGDDVNLGARIMATTKNVGEKLLISAITKKEAEPYLEGVVWTGHGEHSFKGKTAKMELFSVNRSTD